MAEIFKLPSSSYEELLKLIQAYANAKKGLPLLWIKLHKQQEFQGLVLARTTVF